VKEVERQAKTMILDEVRQVLAALADEDARQVFAVVVTGTGTGEPRGYIGIDGRLGASTSYVTVRGLARTLEWSPERVMAAAALLEVAGLITRSSTDDVYPSWRTDMTVLRQAVNAVDAAP
jgi:hypothetical protein